MSNPKPIEWNGDTLLGWVERFNNRLNNATSYIDKAIVGIYERSSVSYVLDASGWTQIYPEHTETAIRELRLLKDQVRAMAAKDFLVRCYPSLLRFPEFVQYIPVDLLESVNEVQRS